MARLIPPLTIATIIPNERKAMMGSWYDIEMRFPMVGKRCGFSADMSTTIATRTPARVRLAEGRCRNAGIIATPRP